MKKIILAALLLGLTVGVGFARAPVSGGDIKATELAVNEKAPSVNPALGANEDAGDFIFDVDVEAVTLDIRCLGVENINDDWWVTGAADMLGAYLYNISYDGSTLLGQFAQGNTSWGWRDLAFDGTYLYCSDSFDIEEVDPATGMVTGVIIASPISPARALAYVPADDVFWTASFSSSLYRVARDGTYTTHTNVGALATYGAAYEPNGDVIWWWSQDGSGTLATAMAPDGTFTGDSWDGGSAPLFGIAGGACVFDDPNYGTVFAGMHQASPDNVAVYEILPDPRPQVDIKCNGGDSGVVIPDTNNAALTIDIEARGGAGIDFDVFCIVRQGGVGRFSYDGTNWNRGLGNCYFSGPLADMTDTVLDQVVPVGLYVATIVLDRRANGVLDTVFAYDQVDFEVKTISGWVEDFEDGVADNWVYDSNWSIVTDPDGDLALYLDCPLFDRFSAYYDFDYSDFFMYSADVQQDLSSSYSTAYYGGIHFRSQDGTLDNGYDYYLSGSGSWYLYSRTGGTGTSLGSGSCTAWNGGPGFYNNLGASANGSTIDIYCNGVLETTVTDSTYASGKCGVNGEGSGIYDHNWFYDNVSLSL